MLSTLVTFLIAVILVITIKTIFNPILLEQQQIMGNDTRLTTLPTITTMQELEQSLNVAKFSYIKINNNRLTQPIVYNKNSTGYLIDKFLAPISTLNSSTENQVIQYTTINHKLSGLVSSIISIIILGLILTMLAFNFIYFRLLKKIECSLVNEIVNDKQKITSFKKVSIELTEQKRLFNEALQNKKEKITILAHQVNLDSLTGLNNRHAFRKQLTEFLSDENNPKHAILSIIRIFELSEINIHRGFQQGDEFVANIANIIKKITERHSSVNVFRISESDFAVIGHDMSVRQGQHFGNELKLKFDQYQLLNNVENVAFNGMTQISSNQLPEHVLARTDIALAKAQTSGINAWAFENNKNNQDFEVGEQHWKKIITEIMANHSFIILQQPIQAIHPDMKGYHEIFTRFVNENSNAIPTDTVFSMAQRTDTIIKLEQVILEKIISHCQHKTNYDIRWGINISTSTIQNSSFIIWLERLLLKQPDIASSLVFEFQENLLESNITSSKRVFNMLKRAGSRSAICNFGKGIGSFRLFKELKPDYIKIDASLVAGIESDSANQQFVRMIIDVAHRMECQVIAEGIEYQEQKEILENMYIDGIQGYLIARPTPLQVV